MTSQVSSHTHYIIEPMRLDDIPQVHAVEVQSFSSPWSVDSYEHDLTQNQMAHYLVLRMVEEGAPAPPLPSPASSAVGLWERLRRSVASFLRPTVATEPRPPIIGFAGLWVMVDEAHLVTIAVAPEQRGKGLGELLLIASIDLACILGASRMTLEVRVSNQVAQSLYRKYGFTNEGVRRRYYSDNGEDALIMTTDVLTSASFQAHYQGLKQALLARINVTMRLT